jgi:8-oxo-dGTP pyrophosphatase MutT (NUDIX family)
MAGVPSHFYTQSAALPYRYRDERLEFLLITSRGKKRWVLPKGVVEPGMSACDSAAREAWEEAGVEGSISAEPLGSYSYQKWGGLCQVEVFSLRVERLAESWPEQARERRWLEPVQAASMVDEPELREILLGSPARLLAGIGG